MELQPVIRPMAAADLPSILRIENRVFSPPWPQEAFREFNHSRSWVLCAEETLLGYIMYHVVPDEAIIVNFAIDPDFWRQGLGRLLLGQTLDWVKESGITKVYLDVRGSNLAARTLYQNFGFQPLGLRKNYYSDPREDALVMMLRLREQA